jgi:DNA-binding CsgD family transcriptional regulator
VSLCTLGLRVEADEAERRRARGSGDAELRAAGTALLERARALWDGMGDRKVSFPEAAIEFATAVAEHDRLTGKATSAAWAAVADGWERLARPYPLAWARWRQAEALVHEKASGADAVLLAALAVTETLPAEALRDELVALARRSRIDLAPPAAPTPKPSNPFHLTNRELQVLDMLKTCSRNKEISRSLFISESTASVHVSNILQKLQARNRGEAAAIAHRLRIGEPDPDAREEAARPRQNGASGKRCSRP